LSCGVCGTRDVDVADGDPRTCISVGHLITGSFSPARYLVIHHYIPITPPREIAWPVHSEIAHSDARIQDFAVNDCLCSCVQTTHHSAPSVRRCLNCYRDSLVMGMQPPGILNPPLIILTAMHTIYSCKGGAMPGHLYIKSGHIPVCVTFHCVSNSCPKGST